MCSSVAVGSFSLLGSPHHHPSEHFLSCNTEPPCPLDSNAPVPASPAPGNYCSALHVYGFDYSRYQIYEGSYNICHFGSDLFCGYNSFRFIQVVVCHNFFFLLKAE